VRILFTGASSFTGYWFVRELVSAGHEVVAACRGDGRYEGLRAERMRMVRELCETRFGCAFGTDDFLALAKTPFDVLSHHGAEAGDYRSPDEVVTDALFLLWQRQEDPAGEAATTPGMANMA